MNFMEAKQENFDAVNKIIKVLHENNCTVAEAQAILNFTANRIINTSKVGDVIDFDFED